MDYLGLAFTFCSRYASLASAMVEAIALGILTAVAPILRVIGFRWNPARTRFIGFVAVSALGVLLWAFVPFIGE